MTRAGRPVLGHVGHLGQAEACEACRIREWRQARGLTQAEAAALTRCNHRSWRRYERQECEIPGPIAALVEALGV